MFYIYLKFNNLNYFLSTVNITILMFKVKSEISLLVRNTSKLQNLSFSLLKIKLCLEVLFSKTIKLIELYRCLIDSYENIGIGDKVNFCYEVRIMRHF